MLENNITTVNNDVKTLVKDAQALFSAAAALTGEKADEVRVRGMKTLDAALVKAQEAQASAIVATKQIAAQADGYVKENPWRTVAVAAGVGVLVGFILGRK
ncbi:MULTISPECIES: YqjD family protein [unclassified Janthinobacterium]|jgi:ElaB/YqjD/DUF883 family membrane-anchored ribosome-binding protein|uniref:DUF883 family protein n=1 Tax=unclassified Janthinobacterium TaxID=2610881 RepID=UPI00160CD9AC|nr:MULTISPECIES: DUF883 family protein [unclassified Janthinobacterium]MBB5610869.1 ElaB/YqjD/DUF883 family membrane-anchored ribosome-binding protein [Janthinobacterium sp. S3T4]MBB5616361.1 ElaB/YqjD/DUF883 family membrane-anchored ribosome-binding protein [Janthinobacterium sp. S3M3]